MAGKMNPAFAAAIARRNAKGKSGGKKANPFAKKGPQDPDAGPNDPAGPMDAQDMQMNKGKSSGKGSLPQFLKK